MLRLKFFLLLIALVVFVLLRSSGTAASFRFEQVYLDVEYGGNGRPGWVRSGDMDGDGDLDVVAGGGNALFVYENDGATDSWRRRGNLDGTESLGSNGALLLDVDGDGDLDVVAAKFYDDIGWWENPCGLSCGLGSAPWAFHKIGEVGTNGAFGPHYFLHDIVSVDFDGKETSLQFIAPAISNTCQQISIQWFEPGADPTKPWDAYVIDKSRSASSDGPCNHAGVDVADVNNDGRLDLAFSNGWYESPADPRSDWPTSSWHPVTSYDSISNTLLRDMDADGRLDLVTASGHADGFREVRWHRGGIDDSWPHTTIATLRSPECLQVLDLDGDQDLDVITCDLDWSQWDKEVHNVYVFENLGGSTSWLQHNVAPESYPSHLLQAVDVDGDGREDVVSEATGFSVISLYENTTPLPEPDPKVLIGAMAFVLFCSRASPRQFLCPALRPRCLPLLPATGQKKGASRWPPLQSSTEAGAGEERV